jgi:hypothetical protein
VGLTYLIVFVVCGVKLRGGYMMAIVPVDVNEASVVSVILYDSFLSDLKSVLVLEGTVSQLEYLGCTFSSKG